MKKKIKILSNKHKKSPEILSFEEKMNEMYNSLKVCELNILVGNDFVVLADKLCDGIWDLREKIKEMTGIIIPPVRIRDSISIQENEFRICFRNKVLYTGYSIINDNYESKDILQSLETVCKENIEEVISNETIERYINLVQENNSWLIWEISKVFSIMEIKKILLGLVKNKRSIKDIVFVFEQMAEYTGTKNTNKLITEISELLPEYNWDIQKNEYPSCNLEKLFQL